MHHLSGKTILELKDVSFSHPDPTGVKTAPALKKINLKISEGDTVSFIGPSGCGKSTLLRLLNRMTDPDDGDILYHDKPLIDHDVLKIRKEILLVPQETYIAPGTIADNLKIAQCDDHISEADMLHVLKSVGLDKPLDLDSTRLSVGEKHRLALARAFLLQPKVLLMDEPAASLDLPGARGVIDTVKDLHHKYNNTIIMVTHRFRLARRLGGTVVMLIGGEIIESGDSADFFKNPRTTEAKNFLMDSEND